MHTHLWYGFYCTISGFLYSRVLCAFELVRDISPGKHDWRWIEFDYNKHQFEEARKMARDYKLHKIEVAKPYADGTATVTQFNQHGDPTKSYKFHNLWPSELAPIPVDWSSDMVEEFTVTFCYDYWTSGTTNSAIANQTKDVNLGPPATPTATIADAG